MVTHLFGTPAKFEEFNQLFESHGGIKNFIPWDLENSTKKNLERIFKKYGAKRYFRRRNRKKSIPKL